MNSGSIVVTTNVRRKDTTKCRFCQKPGKIPIFKSNEIPTAITTFGKINISVHDEFSKLMCLPCYDLLGSAVAFRGIAKQTVDSLKNINLKPETLTAPERELLIANYMKNCRFCLKPGRLPIFESDKIPNALRMLGIEGISKDDKFSKVMCYSCYDLIHSAILFRKRAEEAVQKQKCNDISVILDDLYSNEKQKTILFRKKAEGALQKQKCNDNDSVILDEAYSEEKQKIVSDVKIKISCSRCNIDFYNFETYSEHMKSAKHGKSECPICNKLFLSKSLQKHISYHNSKPKTAKTDMYICDICGKLYNKKEPFNRHKTSHTLELPFKCSLCPYRGRYKEALKMHMRTHTGEKYVCPHCGTRLACKSYFLEHVKRHNKLPDHKCDQCDRTFFTKKKLEEHIKVFHRGVREHECEMCGKFFRHRHVMLCHQRGVHKRGKLLHSLPLYKRAELVMAKTVSTG